MNFLKLGILSSNCRERGASGDSLQAIMSKVSWRDLGGERARSVACEQRKSVNAQ